MPNKSIESAKLKFYEAVVTMRPEQLGMLVKKVLPVRRRYVRDITGVKFWVDPVTAFGLAILKGRGYEPQMVSLIQMLLRPSDTFIDLGANEGYFSILAASAVTQGRVFAIEPQKSLQEVLHENVKTNSAHNVSVHSIAISDQNGEAFLFLRSSINNMASRLNTPFRLGFGSESVQTQTLAHFCREHAIDRARILKVDCEGGEIEVINGSRDLFADRAFDVVALEYHPSICGIAAMQQTDCQMHYWGYKLAMWNGQTIYYLPHLASEIAELGSDVDLDVEWGFPASTNSGYSPVPDLES